MSKAVPVAIPVQNVHKFIEALPDDHRRQINNYIHIEKEKIESEAREREVKLNQRIYMLETQVKVLKVFRDWFQMKSGFGNKDSHPVVNKVNKIKNKRKYDSDDYSSSSSSDSEEELSPEEELAEALSKVMKKN